MNTQINYFGMIAENVQMSSEVISIDSDNGIIDLRDFFESRYPVLKDLSYKIAVNNEFRNSIKAGTEVNEIALLPPFAGG